MIVFDECLCIIICFSCGGGGKATGTNEQSEKVVVNVPQFDADSAYLYVKNQVDFWSPCPQYEGARSLWQLSGRKAGGFRCEGNESVCRSDCL